MAKQESALRCRLPFPSIVPRSLARGEKHLLNDLDPTQHLGGPLRFGIVGTGIMAKIHAASLAAYHRSAIAAWAGPSANEAELAEFGPARVYRDVEDLVGDEGVDAVLVATPDWAHTESALAAIEAGKPVLIEKPLATSSADAMRILHAAQAADVKVMTLFNHRWVPAYWQAKERIANGTFGEPVLAYARKNDTIEVPTEMIAWSERTSPAWFLSSHDIDLVCWYFQSEPIEAIANEVRKVLVSRGIDTPDAIQAQVKFANGALATFEACWTYPNTFPTMTDSFVELVFAGAVLHLDRKREQLEIATEERFEYPRNLLVNRVGGRPSGSTYAAVTHFVDAVLDGFAPLVSLESSVRVTNVLEAIHQSCAQGAPIRIEQEEADAALQA